MMRLTPVRCDVCGKLCYLEEETIYKMTIKGQSDWVKDEELTYDICVNCEEKITKFIEKLAEKK